MPLRKSLTSEWLNTSFHDSIDCKVLNSSILLFVNCLPTAVLFFLFPLPVFIFTACASWSEKPKSTTDAPNSVLSLFITIISIKDSELGIILVRDLTTYIRSWLNFLYPYVIDIKFRFQSPHIRSFFLFDCAIWIVNSSVFKKVQNLLSGDLYIRTVMYP